MYAQKIFLNLLAFIFFVAGIVVGQPQGPMSGAAPKSFTTLPNDVGFLNNSINMFTGQVQFSLPIMGLSGKGNAGYSLALSYSSANVKYISSTWNQEAPTGVMGLGWSFDMPRIVADYKGTGTRDDDDFYIMEGGVSSLLIYDGLDGSDWKYYPKNYQFWKIRYSPSSEKWTITKEDGTKFIYGDANSNRSTVQNMVKWGNWIGNSFNGSGQSLMAYVWNLSETIDLWGDKITFEYQLDKERVGQGIGFMDHTKASYLKEVRNLNGERISFNYLDKINTGGPIEFVDPHTESAEPDAYQEKFESKYLDKVIRYDASNAVMGEIRFGYEITGVGNMAKRRLASIIPYAANSTSTKGYAFQYEANGSDEYNTGALTAVITPTSGSISYNYQKQELANTQLDYLVSPFNAYKEPAIWVGDDFVVIARRNVPGGGYSDHSTDPQSVILDVFTWDGGKWIKQSLGTSYNSTGTLFGVKAKDLGNGYKSHDLQFVAGKGFFGFLNRQGNTNTYNLNLYTKNENKSGEWDSQLFQFGRTLAVVDSNYPWHIDLGDEPILLAGDEFVLIGTQASRNFAFRWDGSVWSETWEANSNGDYRYAAANNYSVIHNKNGSGTDLISFKNLDKSKAWQTHTLPSNQSFNSD
ncbi:MAG: hypothetical protein KF860_15245, partial [Cyclobacteriaceae bacterium]|nr:hypothetical protein [Cyclobacteriaceae bacterium]